MTIPYDGESTDVNVPGILGNNTALGTGVKGQGSPGVWGESQQYEGVHGISHSRAAGVAGVNDNAQGGPAVWGRSEHGIGIYGFGGQLAGFFDGNVAVTGDITFTNADCAEEFDVTATTEVEPGTVMALDQHGTLRPSQQAYDKKVAGVISGAGNYKPGLILDKRESAQGRIPIALVGKVYCKADAQYAPIEIGDLLTTSPSLGHAMKANDPLKAFGAVIGKALRPLKEGQGLIPILIALQ